MLLTIFKTLILQFLKQLTIFFSALCGVNNVLRSFLHKLERNLMQSLKLDSIL